MVECLCFMSGGAEMQAAACYDGQLYTVPRCLVYRHLLCKPAVHSDRADSLRGPADR